MRKILIALLLALTACSSPPDPGPRFDDEGQGELTCIKHQPAPPGPRYTDDTLRRTDETLALLKYYTANGKKPFCDNAPATETDRAWAQFYVTLGADKANVAALLG